jgi:hypothetical protein
MEEKNLYEHLEEIIANTKDTPKIINENSNFVVVTYWWGRGRQNANLARPCGLFYEQLISRVIEKSINVLGSGFNQPYYDIMIRDIHNCNFSREIDAAIKDYYYELMLYLELKPNCFPNITVKDVAIIEKLNSMRNEGKIEPNYNYISSLYVRALIQLVSVEFIKRNKDKLNEIVKSLHEIKQLKNDYSNNKPENKTDFLKMIKDKKHAYNALKTDLKKQMNVKNTYDVPQVTIAANYDRGELFNTMDDIYRDPSIQNKSLNEILIQKLRYKPSITYDEMIIGWEKECEKVNCNHMAIEYNDFTKPNGYQLAINAKPMFIKKALELCHPRNVLYIDGDMYVRHYPHIFDMKDVDYMARGWNIDPRSSDRFIESILYDPYTFETSGGTMFFSQSEEANKLLGLWITETKKPINKGKADDRIISLLFNTKKLLCNMKIIQLPIEYLWLTLFYDDVVGGFLYDYDKDVITESIFIDHPECLTSEDTAAGSGASNQRTPFIYDKFIADITDPVSEELYEYIFFKDKELVKSMEYYFKYMKNAYYFYDGNQSLVEKKFVTPGGSLDENEQPLYIFGYDKKFNKKNDIHDKNIDLMEKADLSRFQKNEDDILEIKNIEFIELIPILLKCMKENQKCIYLPDTHDPEYYNTFKAKNIYKKLEIVYVPLKTSTINDSYNNFYKLGIDTKEPLYINSGEDSVLFKYLSMFNNIDEFTEYMIIGCYFFISLVRVGYLLKGKKTAVQIGGDGNENFDKDVNDYLDGLDEMYSSSSNVKMSPQNAGKRFKVTRKKSKRLGKKTLRKR